MAIDMPTTYPPLSLPAILFAHRGARAHAPENTLEAFRLAGRLGATGLESDVWRTADGEAVLDHDGVVGGVFRRRRVAEVARDELPEHIPTLSELYEAVGGELDLSLDVKDADAVDAVLDAAAAAGASARLWLCHPELDVLASWRERSTPVRLVHSTRLAQLERGQEHHAARLRELGVDAINLHHSEWTAGSVALYHRFGRYCLGWDAQQPRVIVSLLDMGIDGVFSDHVDRMVDAAQRMT
jgi:glycerophosphoryl diester phosphodiesterase